MSEQTTAEKLAAVRCDAAPWGWSDETAKQEKIIAWIPCPLCGSAGIVRCRSGEVVGTSWFGDGKNVSGPEGDLVPLPAPASEPEPERLSDAELTLYAMSKHPALHVRMARELIESRKTIDRQLEYSKSLESNNVGLGKTIAQQSAQLANAADTIHRQAKRCVEITAERDAAIDLARRMNDPRIDARREACIEANSRYGPTPAQCDPPANCEHEWHRDDDLSINQKSCSKCGVIGRTCGACDGSAMSGCECDEWGMVIDTQCAPPPITEPLDPIDDPANTLKTYRVRGTGRWAFFTLGGQQTIAGRTYRAVDTIWIDETEFDPFTPGESNG